ncbi:MAG TPA: response regulator transcription factor [Candidatus Angelobacter sp.]
MAAWSGLVVDDSPIFRRAVCELFTHEAGFRVCAEAENGRDAVEKAKRYRPDIIVTDLFMPLMNGFEETRILRKLMTNVPVIACSIQIDAQIEREALAAGASAFLSKSDAALTLISTAHRLLEERDLVEGIAA